MPRVGETARVKLAGSTGVGHAAPLEDLCQETFRVARKYAEVHRFPAHVHTNPLTGAKIKGHAGHMVMTRLLKQLWPDFNENDFKKTQGLIHQVLRKTDAAVCIKQAKPRSKEDRTPMEEDDLPVWFIADTMPENIVVVAIAHSKKSADQRISAPFDEAAFMTTRERFRVTADEAGETLPPGEVTVTVNTKNTAVVSTRPKGEIPPEFEQHITARMEEHNRFKERVKEEIYTSPVPLTARDITTIVNRDDPEWDQHESSYRNALTELVEEGVIVGRIETFTEKAVRGGGGMPKGKRTTLFWPAPGPVPERTKLPAGVEPFKPAMEWYTERSAEQQADDDLVFGALSRKSHRDRPTPRSSGRLAEATGLPLERVKASLARMLSQGRIVEHKGMHRPSERVKSERPAAPVIQQPEEAQPVFTAEPTQDTVQTPPTRPKPVSDPGNLALVLDLASRLGVELPKEDTGRVHELEAEVSDLTRDNDKLRGQVAALKAAIASLD